MKSFLARLKADDSGFSLAEVMVTVVINGLTVTVLAAAIVRFTYLQQSFSYISNGLNQAATSETHWRTDINNATNIAPYNTSSVAIASLMPSGYCQQKTYSTSTSAGMTQLQVVSKTYSMAPGSDGSCTLSGLPATTTTSILIGDVGSTVSFHFTNLAGRPIVYTANIGTFGTATQPATITNQQWASTVIGEATMNATTESTMTTARATTVTQVAVNLAHDTTTNKPTQFTTT